MTAYDLLKMVEPSWLYINNLPATTVVAVPMPSLSNDSDRDETIAVLSVLFVLEVPRRVLLWY